MFEPYANEHEGEHSFVPNIDDIDKADPDTYDTYIGAEVELSIGDLVMTGKVKQQKHEHDGTIKGTAHSNPILNTKK